MSGGQPITKEDAPRPEPGRGAGEWFDSHCHVQERYVGQGGATAGSGVAGPRAEVAAGAAPGESAPGEVLRRAGAAGVGTVVCVGTDATTSAQALALAAAARSGALGANLPAVWATVGLHPHEASAGPAAVLRLAEEAATDGTLVAVGECGLDYHYDHSPRAVQRDAFADQIALAHRLDLALVIHVRSAWGDLFEVLHAEGVPERTVLHCFTGGPEEVRRCLDAGMYVSFSGIVTFKNAPEIREAAALCPSDRLLIETDSPFLSPVPHRGTVNEPARVSLVGAAVAALKHLDPIDVARSTAAAAARAFGL